MKKSNETSNKLVLLNSSQEAHYRTRLRTNSKCVAMSKVFNDYFSLPYQHTPNRKVMRIQKIINVLKELYDERSLVQDPELQWIVLDSPFYHVVFSDTCETSLTLSFSAHQDMDLTPNSLVMTEVHNYKALKCKTV